MASVKKVRGCCVEDSPERAPATLSSVSSKFAELISLISRWLIGELRFFAMADYQGFDSDNSAITDGSASTAERNCCGRVSL